MKDTLEKMDTISLSSTEPPLMGLRKTLEYLRMLHRRGLIDSSMLIQKFAEQYNVVHPSSMITGMSGRSQNAGEDLTPIKRNPIGRLLIFLSKVLRRT